MSPKFSKKTKQYEKFKPYTPSILITTDYLSALKQASPNTIDLLRINVPTPTLPPSFFSIFKHLRVLDLRNAGLQRLPSRIIELVNLEKLDLRYNNLTYLPSQIAQLPNLHQLQIEDVRQQKSRLLKEVDIPEDPEPIPNAYQVCSCRTRGNCLRIPPLPSLTQLCTKKILTTIPTGPPDDPEELCWKDLEPFYSTGKFEDNPNHSLPFPSHLLPDEIPVDLCAACSEIVFPIHAQFDKVHVVALCRVRLRYIFCSHGCLSNVIERWEMERKKEEAKKLSRQKRFHTKDYGHSN